MYSCLVYLIVLAYISAGFSLSHHIIYFFYAVEVHAIITEGIVGFDLSCFLTLHDYMSYADERKQCDILN